MLRPEAAGVGQIASSELMNYTPPDNSTIKDRFRDGVVIISALALGLGGFAYCQSQKGDVPNAPPSIEQSPTGEPEPSPKAADAGAIGQGQEGAREFLATHENTLRLAVFAQ